MEYKLGQTVRDTMDNFSLIANTAKVSKHGQMEDGMKAIGLGDLSTEVVVCTTQSLELLKKVSG